MRKSARIVFVLLLAIVTCSFISDKGKKFTYGQIKDGIYTNSYFNMEMPLPDKWVVQNREQITRIEEKGREIVAGDDKDLQRALKNGTLTSATLMVLYKYELGSAVDYNPSFSMVAEKVSEAPGIVDGADYLFNVRRLLQRSAVKIKCEDGDFTPVTIGGEQFYMLKASMDYMGLTIRQQYYSTVKNGFALSMVVAFIDEDQKAELEKIIGTIKFTK